MTLTGKWTNTYGSVMELTQSAQTGVVFGTYSSTTGSTGRYYVYGWATSQDPTPSLGQAASLCIFWRSIAGGQGDPSWHWVSGLGGQLWVSNAGEETLGLIHAMVATDEFPGLAAPGTYLDKLLYTRSTGSPPAASLPDHPNGAIADPIEGSWLCLEDPNIWMSLAVANQKYGAVQGTLVIGSSKYLAYGFTDTYASSGGLTKQSFCLTAPGNDGKAKALAGSLDYGTRLLSVTVLENLGTPNDATYVTTTTKPWTFRPT